MSHIRYIFNDWLYGPMFSLRGCEADALELYNALANTNHDDPAKLDLAEVSGAALLGYQGDVSLLISDDASMVEHQPAQDESAPAPMILSQMYESYASSHHLDPDGSPSQGLPAPRFIVLYFGEEERPDSEVMRLSDSYEANERGPKVEVTVLNCNEGHNPSIMDACRALREYSHLVTLDREDRKRLHEDMRRSVNAAIDQCIEEGRLVDFLTENRSEVEEMLFTAQDEERAMRVHLEAIRRQAVEKTTLENLTHLMESAGCDADAAMGMLQIPEADRETLRARLP